MIFLIHLTGFWTIAVKTPQIMAGQLTLLLMVGGVVGGITSTSGGNFAELNNGDPIAGTQALNVDYTMTTSNPIDVSGLGLNEQLVLEFQQYGALFHDKQEVIESVMMV